MNSPQFLRCVAVAWLVAASCASAAEKRLAIVAPNTRDHAILADTVLARFPREAGIALVEREELQRVVNEAALQAMLSNPAERRRIGQILNADYLLLINGDVTASSTAGLLLETRSGARLARRVWSVDATNDVANAIVAFTTNTLARFPSGAQSVIGVPPFLSKALSHDFDSLQNGFARLLAATLESQPGLAVIELEQAEAIARELALTGGGVERIVPLLVRGEFSVPPDAPATNRLLRLTVEISDGAKSLASLSIGPVEHEAAARWISGEVGTRVSTLAGSGSRPLSAEEQFRALIARADEFATLGAFLQSSGLREAALLLADVPTQRERLVAEYLAVAGSSKRRTFTRVDRPPLTRAQIAPLIMAASNAWRAAQSHLDYLLVNQQIALAQFTRLTDEESGVARAVYPESREGHVQFKRDHAARMLANMPHMLKLMQKEGAVAGQVGVVHQWVRAAYSTPGRDAEDYAYLLKVLEFVPVRHEPMSEMVYLAAHVPVGENSPDHQLDIAREHFLIALTNSPTTLNRIYGRYGLLYRTDFLEQRRKKTSPATVAAIEALAADFDHWCKTNRVQSRGPLETGISDLLARARRGLAGSQPRTYVRRATQPPAEMGRIGIEEIPYEVLRSDGKREPWRGQNWAHGNGLYSVQHFRRAHESLNILWSVGAVLFEREANFLEPVQTDRKATFDDVVWDGERAWVGTRHSGIWLLDGGGRKTSVIDERHGFPAASGGIVLHVLGPGRIVASGSFGEHRRGWIALIGLTNGEPDVRVIHTGTRVTGPLPARDTALEADHAFVPSWLLAPENVRGERPNLIVGCDRTRRALQVDLQSWRVQAVQWPVFCVVQDRFAWLSHRGKLFYTRDSQVLEYPVDPTSDVKPRAFCVPKNSEGVKNGGLARHLLVPGDGWVYAPGLIWFRFDPATGREEKLSPDRLPRPASDQRKFAVAAFHGMIGWDYGKPFYRFYVEDSAGGGIAQ